MNLNVLRMLKNKIVDAHCHLESGVLSPNIALAITNSVQMSDWGTVVKMSGQGGIFGAIGVHPWYVSGLTSDWEKDLRRLLNENPTLMVGEIGLDKNYPDIDRQLEMLTTQMQLATELGRIVHIHCIGAWDMVLGTLAKYTPPAIVFHGFDASTEIINQLLRYNSYFSFGRAVCNPLRRRVQNALRAVPQNRILSESDTTNPTDVIPVVQRISEILACPLADMTNTIYNNMTELLKNG